MQRLAVAQLITVYAEGCKPHTHTHTRDKTNKMNSDAADLLIKIILSVSVLAILTSNKPTPASCTLVILNMRVSL